ncbi:MAG TPA: orotate phosphoribosyltransferase [Candidatus Kerfeldbacteria bacterium]|nr:MAG: Orotate phosphoribosyltransferase [Parcubacteria group bacterium GW2011_GWA2_48_9]KKW16468.1 MAG: Orotate phosphoribosyltransferase [Parcubacteria group bacterium GW2011_GWC2_49_9]HCJ52394.1 orotate phosphoribosyltransferase [Candidatus Kerfeldbacteria bacterium]HCM67707.1 orotate phosphoribosyltransferase [Candidatus Kerfeldbacteria bacterium]
MNDVATILLKIRAVTLSPKEPYTFTSGLKSPIYCDNRLLMSYPEFRKRVIDEFIAVIQKNHLTFDIVGGTATAGIPHAAWIADRLEKPMIYIRGASKEHGKKNQIEGKLGKDQKVLIIEDLISTGGSSVSAVEAVREAGGVVGDCCAIFTYEFEKAKQKFTNATCKLFTLTTFSELLTVAEEQNYITSEEEAIAREWKRDPEKWGEQFKS